MLELQLNHERLVIPGLDMDPMLKLLMGEQTAGMADTLTKRAWVRGGSRENSREHNNWGNVTAMVLFSDCR